MAKVTIVFEDVDDSLEIRAEFEPQTGAPEDDTLAQGTARDVLIALYRSQDWDEAHVNSD